ncbi:hypothetical protein TI01_1852 [Lysobacter sp. A03]|nr:hypothetical protein TI01_1852 [Lysobacter sp. A03]
MQGGFHGNSADAAEPGILPGSQRRVRTVWQGLKHIPRAP